MVTDTSGAIKTFKIQPIDGKASPKSNETMAIVPEPLKAMLKQRLAESGPQAKAKSIPVELFEAKNLTKIPNVGMQPTERPTFPEDLFVNAIQRSLAGNRALNGDASKMSPHEIAQHYAFTIEHMLTAIPPQQRIYACSRLERAIGEIVAEMKIF